MKIRITESEIEASAEELSSSATLRDSFLDTLRGAFLRAQRPLYSEAWDADEDADDDEPEDDDD